MATSAEDVPASLAAGLRASVQLTSSLYRAAACSVALVGPDDGLRFVAAHGVGEAEITGQILRRDTGIAGWVVSSGAALAVADVTRDPRFSAQTAQLTGYMPRTILGAPLLSGGETIGVVEVLDPAARERDLEVLSLVGSLLGATFLQDRPRPSPLDDAVDAVRALGPRGTELAVGLLRSIVAYENSGR